MSLLNESQKYYDKVGIEHRKKHGQYFTEDKVKSIALSKVDLFDGCKILENSCGSGEFIHSMLEINSNIHIDAYDIEPRLVKSCQKSFPSVNTQCKNFLELIHRPEYDYVIGNPPYFEYLEKDMSMTIAQNFKSIFKGKPNIYALFIKAGIDCLKPSGKLVYVVPTSMNNGAYFQKLRDYIVDTCDIEDMRIFGDSEFQGAQQNVMILVLKRLKDGEKNSGKFVFKKGSITVFSQFVQQLEDRFENGKTLEELKFKVMTGNLVWNQNKEYMSRDNTKDLLVWSCNIVNNKFVPDVDKLNQTRQEGEPEKTSHQKGQYVSVPEDDNIFKPKLLKGDCIVVKRTTGSGAKATISAAILKKDQYYVENHVNYIVKEKDCEYSLESLHKELIKKETTRFAQMLTGNTQISKTELQKIIPFELEKEET
mgnify:CR=1 FL=1